MHHGLSDETLQKIRGVFAHFQAIEKAVLYGSRAKGNYKTGSDIDLVLYGTELTADRLWQIMDALDDLMLPYCIDLSLFAQLDHELLIKHIEQAGKVFYERSV
ncbi:nucleotidyltransferase domain-containing protein [Methylomonas sp. AM2-LC]|uniref:nucleotidyltransferase domain-containing protein n=1 Tax=Methylomonas sp. AM2-LC TaxID=3153301 RepID=UPI0032634710